MSKKKIINNGLLAKLDSTKWRTQSIEGELHSHGSTGMSAVLRASITQPLPEDHPTYALIGRVASEWARYEGILDRIIWKLADLSDPRGACMTAQLMGAGTRLVTITSLANHRGILSEISETIEGLEKKTHDLQEKRNRTVHDPWFFEQLTDTVKQHRSQPKKQRVFGFVPIDSNWLNTLIQNITKLNDRALALHNKLSNTLPE